MNSLEAYNLRYILNDFVHVDKILKDKNNYLISLKGNTIKLDTITKINKQLNLNNYELKEITTSSNNCLRLIIIKNIHIKNNDNVKIKKIKLRNLNLNNVFKEIEENNKFPFNKRGD